MEASKTVVRGERKWVVSLGKKQGFSDRVRVFGETREEAERRAVEKIDERRLHGSGLADISSSHRALIIEWRDRLTVEQMVAAFAAFQANRGFTRRVGECVADYIAVKTKPDDRGRRVWSKEHASAAKARLGRFGGAFGPRVLGALIPGEIEDFVRKQNGSAGDYHRALRAFFGHARRHRWIAQSPFEEMGKAPDGDGAAKDLMSPAQFKQLLRVAAGLEENRKRHESLLAAFVLGGLAGLRTAEARRLTWSKLDLAAGRIELDRDTTRKRGLRGRFVTLEPAALAWLRTLKAGAPAERVVGLTDKNFRDARTSMATAAKIKTWSHNVLRRSFASYHLALHEDGGRTAAAMGHTDADTTFAKYRVPAKREDAAAWFALSPETVAKP